MVSPVVRDDQISVYMTKMRCGGCPEGRLVLYIKLNGIIQLNTAYPQIGKMINCYHPPPPHQPPSPTPTACVLIHQPTHLPYSGYW